MKRTRYPPRWVPSEADDWLAQQMERADDARRVAYTAEVEHEVDELKQRRLMAYDDIQRRSLSDEIGKLHSQRDRHLKAPLDPTRPLPCKTCGRHHGLVSEPRGHS